MTKTFKAFILAICLVSLLPAPALSASERRTALVIGNGAYEGSRLKNPVNDAVDMAAALKELGFTVVLKKDVKLKEMETAISDFGKSLKQGGVGLFYYAGHGLQVGGINYLVPIGIRIAQESDVKYETVDAGRVLDEMDNAGNGLNIVILDACRDNPFARSFRSTRRGLAVLSSAPVGSFISYSTGPGQVARDGAGNNSPYAVAMLKYMREPGLTIEQVSKKIRHQLGEETGGQQVPWELSSLDGDFFFVPGKTSITDRTSGGSEPRKDKALTVAAKKRGENPGTQPPAYTDTVTGMEFILVKGGCYQMGDGFGDGDAQEKPVHEVCLDDFYMGKYEVTQGQWQKVMANNPSHFKHCGEACPVESVSWSDAQSFIAELNGKSGQKYRLPTEAEWEYAARSGGKMDKWAGTSSESRIGDFAWYEANAEDRTHRVGERKPNGLGIYDMTGNVWEWVQDWYDENYYKASPQENPKGPNDGTSRVLRGGCWLDQAKDTRSSFRFFFSPGKWFKSVGIRLVKSP